MNKSDPLLCLQFHYLKKLPLSFVLFLFFISNSSATTSKGILADIVVNGKVLEQENNQPLSKVTLTLKGFV